MIEIKLKKRSRDDMQIRALKLAYPLLAAYSTPEHAPDKEMIVAAFAVGAALSMAGVDLKELIKEADNG